MIISEHMNNVFANIDLQTNYAFAFWHASTSTYSDQMHFFKGFQKHLYFLAETN